MHGDLLVSSGRNGDGDPLIDMHARIDDVDELVVDVAI